MAGVRILWLTLSIVVLDQVTKLLVKGFVIPGTTIYYEGMQIGQSIPLLGDFLRLTYVENAGMAFGVAVPNRLLFSLITIVAVIVLCVYLFRIRNESLKARLPFAVILGGAIGNLIDRVFYGVIFGEGPLFYGKVVDFIDVDFFDISLFGYELNRWAVFNIADASVTIGLFLLLLFYKSIPEGQTAPQPEESGGTSSSNSETETVQQSPH